MHKAYFKCKSCNRHWVKRNVYGPLKCGACECEVKPYRQLHVSRQDLAILKGLKRLAEEMCHVVIADDSRTPKAKGDHNAA